MADTPLTEPPIHLLAGLASLGDQRRYVIHGTAEEYLDVEDLLNNAWHFCERASYPQTEANLSEEQRASVARLKEAVDRLGQCIERYDRSNIADLIERDSCWAVIRDQAAEAMIAFGESVPD